MRVLGIDPGIGITGWAVADPAGDQCALVAAGIIKTPANSPTPPRLAAINAEMTQLIATYQPTELAIEKLFFSKNVTTGMRVSEARGVILMTCAQSLLGISEYTPAQIKQAVTGYGKATKRQVIDMLTHHIIDATVPSQDDAADAVAVSITHLASSIESQSAVSSLGGQQ